MSSWKVELAVYDISMGMASQMSMAILGQQIEAIYHTGIIVYGKEFFFGGGIQQCAHEQFVSQHGGIRPIQIMELGHTDIPEEVFQDFLRELSPRFTMATYDLIKNNCNNFSDACADFLLGKGIPEHIVGLPERVFSTPMGQMLKPMIEGMQNSINNPGGVSLDPFGSTQASFDPFSVQPAQAPMTHMPVPAAAAVPPPPVPSSWAAQNLSAATPSFPPSVVSEPEAPKTSLLDKYSKPLLSADRSGVAAMVDSLKTKVNESTTFSLEPEQLQTLDGLGEALSKGGVLPPNSWSLLLRLLQEGPANLVFLSLCFTRLGVMAPAAEGDTGTMSCAEREVVRHIIEKLQVPSTEGGFSVAATVMGLCVITNMFAQSKGIQYLISEEVRGIIIDLALQKMHHERIDVRGMACTILHSYSLHLPQPTNNAIPDEVTQIFLGAIEGLDNELEKQCNLRRCLCIGHLVKRYQKGVCQLISDLGFDEVLQRLQFAEYLPEESKNVISSTVIEIRRISFS